MTIHSILEQLETSSHPVAKAIHKGEHSKVLAIGFKKGMILKEHKTHQPTHLTCLYGRVFYKQGLEEKVLTEYDETSIPVDLIHSVEALEDSLCLLCVG